MERPPRKKTGKKPKLKMYSPQRYAKHNSFFTVKGMKNFIKFLAPKLKVALYRIDCVIFRFAISVPKYICRKRRCFTELIYFVAALATIAGGIAALFAFFPQIVVAPPVEHNNPFSSKFSIQNNSFITIENVSIAYNYNFDTSDGSKARDISEPTPYKMGDIERGEILSFRIRNRAIGISDKIPVQGFACVMISYEYFYKTYIEFRGFVFDKESEGSWEKDTNFCNEPVKMKLQKLYIDNNR